LINEKSEINPKLARSQDLEKMCGALFRERLTCPKVVGVKPASKMLMLLTTKPTGEQFREQEFIP
jgi:hypothetical protein